jgi:hypothetical protein
MWFNDDEYEDDNGPSTNPNSTSGQVTSPANLNSSQSTSVSPNTVSQVHQPLTDSNNSPTVSGLSNSSPSGGSPILGSSNNAAVSLAAAAAVAACGAAPSSPLAAAAAVAASAGATVGFSAVVDGVVSGDSDPGVIIPSHLEGQTILSEKEDASIPTLNTVKKALVDYDSDEDEDDDEDDEACEDEDEKEVVSNRQSCPSEESTSTTAITSTKISSVPNETNKPDDMLEIDSTTKDVPAVQSKTELQSINSEKISVINSDDKKEILTEQFTTASENTADTHDSEQSLAKTCNNSIVQKSVENSERQQNPANEDKVAKEDDLKSSNATSRQDSKESKNAPLNVVHVSSDGDGKTHVSVPSLIRSNECLEDSDGGPLSKRQRLCSIEDKKGEEIQDKELSSISEAKLQ